MHSRLKIRKPVTLKNIYKIFIFEFDSLNKDKVTDEFSSKKMSLKCHHIKT